MLVGITVSLEGEANVFSSFFSFRRIRNMRRNSVMKGVSDSQLLLFRVVRRILQVTISVVTIIFNHISTPYAATSNSPKKKKLNRPCLFLMFSFPTLIMLSPLKYIRNLPTLIVTCNILRTTLNNRSWLSLTPFITEFLRILRILRKLKKLEKTFASPSKLTVIPTSTPTLLNPNLCWIHPHSLDTRHYLTFKALPKRRVLSKIGVKVAMKSVRTIGHIIPSPKDPISPDEINCLVYEIPCNDCDFVYIGQTKRNLNTRLKEHQRAIKQQKPENSALCEHVMETDHLIGWSNARILKVETNYFKRLTAESWFIHSYPKVLNRSDGESLPVIYRSLL